ncbi:hypothetical protein [Rhodococcus oryzae]|uniref:hypothetical protein n=1 Tax=Rhodococcus oryzae TaxID=2571143 RepID=UPI0037BA5A0F
MTLGAGAVVVGAGASVSVCELVGAADVVSLDADVSGVVVDSTAGAGAFVVVEGRAVVVVGTADNAVSLAFSEDEEVDGVAEGDASAVSTPVTISVVAIAMVPSARPALFLCRRR